MAAKRIVRTNNLPAGLDRMYWRTNARDLFFFCTAILKTAWEGDKFNNFGKIHRALCSFIDPGKPKNRRMFISMFRGSFKSTIILGMCLYLFTWAVVEGKSLSIVYNTATKENASAFMEDFRTTQIECKFLQWIFPELPTAVDQFQSWHLFRLEYKKVKFHVSSLDTQQVGRHYQCILPGIYVHTSNGIDKVENIKPGNRVLGMNGKHNEVVAVKESLHKGKISEISLWGQPEPIKSTPEHRFLVWDKFSLAWKEAGDIRRGDYLATPLPTGLTRAYSRVNARINKILEYPESWRFIGYWLAEGCASEGNRVRLTFGKTEKDYAEEVKGIIGRVAGCPVNIHPTNSSTIMVDFSDADIKEILGKFGTHSYDKHLPALALSLNPNRQREMIIGYFRGDGSGKTGRWIASSVSRALLEGMKIVLANNGIESSISNGAGPKISNVMGNYVKTRQGWHLSSSSPMMNLLMGTPAKFQTKPSRMTFVPGFMLEKVKKVSSSYYDGPVYDLQSRKTESFSVMGGLAHNCIINDDLVNDTNAFSETERKNVKRKWSLQKAILTKYRKFGIAMEIEVGTPYHKHDLVSHIMKNSRGYEKFIIPYAIKNKANKLVLSFPEMFSWEDFEERRVDMGESLFATQYRLCVLDETDKLADEEWLKDWADLPDNYTRYLIIDPAGTENKKRNDPTGFLVFDIDERGYYYIRYCEESWLPPAKGLKHAEYIANRFGTDENYFEKEKYSISIASTAEYITPSFTFGLIDHKNEPPEKRIHRLKQFFETGRILFGPGQEALKRQITGYPDIEHDDLLNCLAHAIRQAQPPKKGVKRDHEDGKEKDFCDQMAAAQERMRRIVGGPSMDAYF